MYVCCWVLTSHDGIDVFLLGCEHPADFEIIVVESDDARKRKGNVPDGKIREHDIEPDKIQNLVSHLLGMLAAGTAWRWDEP